MSETPQNPSNPGPNNEPFTQEGRARFIRGIVRDRIDSEPCARIAAIMAGADIDSLPEFIIMGTPDASLVRIAERFAVGKKMGLSDQKMIQVIHHEFKTAMEGATPFPFPPVPQPIDLWGYARYFLDSQHRNSAPVSDDYIDHVFRATFWFYNFSGSPQRVVTPAHESAAAAPRAYDSPAAREAKIERMADRLVSIEAARPGTVRMRVNPFTLTLALDALAAKFRLKKPFFANAEHFLIDSVLKQSSVMMLVLQASMLAGPTNQEGLIQCWAGSGKYVGVQGLFQMADFTSGNKDNIILIIDIEPFFGMVADLLEQPLRG